MLGSHNSLTFLKSKNPIFELFSFLWRCQTKTLNEQYEKGVRFFDIRLARNKNGSWSPCHGLVKLDLNINIMDYIYAISIAYPCAKIRLICERSKDIKYFKKEINSIIEKIPKSIEIITEIIIKKNWEVLYRNNPLSYQDFTYIPWNTGKSFWWNIKHFKFSTIKKWAEQHNPEITNMVIANPNIIYFIDYIK